jgi:hypothetical protein
VRQFAVKFRPKMRDINGVHDHLRGDVANKTRLSRAFYSLDLSVRKGGIGLRFTRAVFERGGVKSVRRAIESTHAAFGILTASFCWCINSLNKVVDAFR